MGTAWKTAAVAAAMLLLAGVSAPADAAASSPGRCSPAMLGTDPARLTVISGGLSRSVSVRIPDKIARGRALPLVIDLHGSSGNGARQAADSALADVGRRNGFIVANPDAGITLPGAPEAHYWNIPGVPLTVGATPAGVADDVQFIADLIDQLVATGCIDARRVYVTGMSGGARMTSLLACRLATRIAAVAPVAGLRAGRPDSVDPSRPDAADCRPSRPVPIVTFHGTGDPVNPYDGGGPPYWGYGVNAALERWAEINSCQARPVERRVAPHVTSHSYRRCAGGAEVRLYRINASPAEGGGHTWPGAPARAGDQRALQSPPTQEISASELLWRFVKRFRLP